MTVQRGAESDLLCPRCTTCALRNKREEWKTPEHAHGSRRLSQNVVIHFVLGARIQWPLAGLQREAASLREPQSRRRETESPPAFDSEPGYPSEHRRQAASQRDGPVLHEARLGEAVDQVLHALLVPTSTRTRTLTRRQSQLERTTASQPRC